MADVGPGFHFDVIKNSIKDLQQEKLRNERKLSEARARRRSLESKYEAALSKYNAAQETNQKMTDTLKVTQFKVLQSQAAIECQHNANQEVENRIAHIKTAFKNEEARQLEETEKFKEKLAGLAEMFHNGKDFYLDHSLQAETGMVKADQKDITQKVNQTDSQVEKLQGVFEALEIVARKQDRATELSEIPLELQYLTLAMFEEERKTVEDERAKLREKQECLLTQLEN
ncbi:uncharacterized protein [Asterias amurensis]|uniref:uncharacterized protein n=1 Tax=Asterias amurensis TaxID=7602 RepID=UPI003AB44ED6